MGHSESTWSTLNGRYGAGGCVPSEGGGGRHPVEKGLCLPFHRVLLHVFNHTEKGGHFSIRLSPTYEDHPLLQSHNFLQVGRQVVLFCVSFLLVSKSGKDFQNWGKLRWG